MGNTGSGTTQDAQSRQLRSAGPKDQWLSEIRKLEGDSTRKRQQALRIFLETVLSEELGGLSMSPKQIFQLSDRVADLIEQDPEAEKAWNDAYNEFMLDT